MIPYHIISRGESWKLAHDQANDDELGGLLGWQKNKTSATEAKVKAKETWQVYR